MKRTFDLKQDVKWESSSFHPDNNEVKKGNTL